MASFRNRQSSENNQSVPETGYVPETHSYQEKHFQPPVNEPVVEGTQYTEVGATVTPDPIETNPERHQRSDVTETSDQPGENNYMKQQLRQELQGNSDSGTQYSTPDVSSGVSSGPGGYSGFESSAATAATTTTAATTASTVAISSTVATVSSVAVAAAGAVVIAATLILPLVMGVPSAIIFEDISVTDTSVYYTIFFEDYEEDMELTVSLHNNFTNRTHTVESHSISILEENLKPGMEYKITVYGSMSAVLGERTVTTDKNPSAKVDVSAAEFSKDDGMIHASATLNDPKGIMSSYRAVFYDTTDGKHVEVNSAIIESFDSEIVLDPRVAADTVLTGMFAIEGMEGDSWVTMYETEMSVIGIPYFALSEPFTVIDNSVTLRCITLDPNAVRSDYKATLTVTNANDSNKNFELTESFVDGTCSFTGINWDPDTKDLYTFYDVDWVITCTENGATKSIQKGSYSPYTSPELSLERSGLDVTRELNQNGSTSSLELAINLEVVDKNDEWTDLKAVLSGYDGRGNLLTAEKNFTKQDKSVTIDVSGNGMKSCEDCTLAIKNGDTVLREFTGLYMTPSFTLGNVSYDGTNARVELLDIHDSFDEWINSNNGEWINNSYSTPRLATSTGRVDVSSGTYTAVFEGFDSSYLNRSISISIGETSIGVVVYHYELASHNITVDQSVNYAKLGIYGPNNAITDTNATVSFAEVTQSFIVETAATSSNTKYIKFPLTDAMMNTSGVLTITVNNATVINETLTFDYPPVGVALNYTTQGECTLEVDCKDLEIIQSETQLVSMNGSTLPAPISTSFVSGSICLFQLTNYTRSDITAEIQVGGGTFTVTADYTYDYTLSDIDASLGADSYAGSLVINGPILDNWTVAFTANGITSYGVEDGSGMPGAYSISLSYNQLNTPGTFELRDYNGRTFYTTQVTFDLPVPVVISTSFVPNHSSQYGTATLVVDMSGITLGADTPYIYSNEGTVGTSQCTIDSVSGQCTFTFELENTSADGQLHTYYISIEQQANYQIPLTFEVQ